MVIAKFTVNQVAPSNNTEHEFYSITLSAVTSGSEENKEFFKWTPSATITLQTVNPAAAAQFEVGKEYYVQFVSTKEADNALVELTDKLVAEAPAQDQAVIN